ncbi:MAG: ModE family transcriptional regulator [Arcobacteraceae bacterium]
MYILTAEESMSKEIEIISKYLDNNGKLPCIKAFAVAKKLGISPCEIGALTKELGIKVSDCELGVFGDLEFLDKNEKIYEKISILANESKQIECKVLWDEAKKSSLKIVGSTVKNSDLEVVYCQLGCFRTRSHSGRKH